MKVQFNYGAVEALQVSVENTEELARWCSGSIKSTALPAEEREIEVSFNGEEDRAAVGDWILRVAHAPHNQSRYKYLVFDSSDFGLIFKEVP